MKYLKVWTSFLDIIKPLENAEVGRLFINMLIYAETGVEPAEMAGNERFIWPMAKQTIDLAAEKAETLRRNGQRGGRPKTEDIQEKPNESKNNQTEPNDNQTKAYKEKKRKEMERNEIESSFIGDEEAFRIQGDHDLLLNAADDAGFPRTNSVTAGILNLYSEYGKDKVLNGIQACVDHGAVNLAYLRACMKDTPKAQKGKILPAQDFQQRDYSGVQKQLEEEQKKHVIEMLCKSNGLWDEVNNRPVDGWREKLDRMKEGERSEGA